jgi:hypothetical protein
MGLLFLLGSKHAPAESSSDAPPTKETQEAVSFSPIVGT